MNDERKVWEACEDAVLRTGPTQDQFSPTQTSSSKQTGKLRQIIPSSGSQNMVSKPAAASAPENLLEIWVLRICFRSPDWVTGRSLVIWAFCLFVCLINLFSVEDNYLAICGGFCHMSTWINPGAHVCPVLTHLPPHSIPLGCPRVLVWVPFMHRTCTGPLFHIW